MQTTVPASTVESGHVTASAQQSTGAGLGSSPFVTAARLIQRVSACKAAFGCDVDITFRGHYNSFAIREDATQTHGVTLPLALVFYEDLIPGSQLINRLQDSQYRVQAVSTLDELTASAASTGPMLIFADLICRKGDVCAVIRKLRGDPATAHIPIIGFADDAEAGLQAAGRQAGATLVVADSVILTHLTQFIERALQVE